MKAVLRLIYTYFTCTPAARIFSITGVVLIVMTWGALRIMPPTFLIGVALLVGIAALYIGSSMMPLMLGRMARSQSFRAVPAARIKLLASALVTVLIVAMPLPILAVYGLMVSVSPHAPIPTAAQLAAFHAGLVQTFWSGTSTSILVAGWLYVVLWFITSQRNIVGYLKGLTVIAIVMFFPTRNIVEPDALARWDVTICAVNLLAFSALFVFWPRLRLLAGRLFGGAGGRKEQPRRFRVSGREIDLLLGTANPWLLAVGQLIPVVLATRIGFYSAAVWLYYLTIFSTVTGAIAGQAAERSRALWLRGDWSPAQLFVRVEKSFWRHNGRVLAVLLVLLVAIGTYEKLPMTLLAAGLPLIVLGTTLSTYLGLMVTRGLRWTESLLAIAVMLTLMAVAVLAARSGSDFMLVVGLECALALLAVILRFAALGRWARIDWTQCRADRALSGRSAAAHH
jgi:hypothetical protein